MKVIIDIPKEFENDYKSDNFKDFFSRVLCDIKNGTLCGNYEKETAEMFLTAFDESVPMDNIVEKLEKLKKDDDCLAYCYQFYSKTCDIYEKAMNIVKPRD